MKITKEKLNQIIKEEIEAAIDEGFMSKLGSKLGIASKSVRDAINGYEIATDSALRLAKKVADDPEKEYNVDKYLKLKLDLAQNREAAARAIESHGGTAEQKKKFWSLEADHDTYEYRAKYADEAIARLEQHRAKLKAAIAAEDAAREAAYQAEMAHKEWKRQKAADRKAAMAKGGGCYDRCREKHADDLRRGYTRDYDICKENC